MPQEEVLFGIRVADTDAESYCTLSSGEVLKIGRDGGKTANIVLPMYEERRATFVPWMVCLQGKREIFRL